MTPHAQGLVDIGKLVFTFAKVNRVTLHEDGVRKESDTDHTVMLSVCACALAERLYPDLDLGEVAQFALVHDLVEAYADDTDSFGITEEGRKAKEEREAVALTAIHKQFDGVFPWIGEKIDLYESLSSKEARFVKTVDKAMSKITHVLNGGQYFKNRGLDEESMWGDYMVMITNVEKKYGAEFPELTTLMRELMLEARIKTYNK